MIYLTPPLHDDGFGAQFGRHVTALALSYKFNWGYLPRCLNIVEHLTEQQVKKVSSITNITGYKSLQNLAGSNTVHLGTNNELNTLNRYISFFKTYEASEDVVLSIYKQYELVSLANPADIKFYKKALSVFREHVEKKFELQSINKQIAIHVRRGDLLRPYWAKLKKTTSIADIKGAVFFLLDNFKGFQINIFTQITELNLGEFDEVLSISPLIKLRPNEDAIENWIEMINSEILVVDSSALSKTAAWLSNNKIFYLPHCYKDFSSWEEIK